jgi:hypothetical protein
MAMSFVHPFEIWAGTCMSFSGGGTSSSHRANRALHVDVPLNTL